MIPEFVRSLKAGLRARMWPRHTAAGFPPKTRLAFVFHGGDKPRIGTGQDFYNREPVFRESVEICSGVIAEHAGFDVREYFSGEANSSNESVEQIERRNIILISVFELALADLWRSRGIWPDVVAGACSGEVAAAYSAGALTIEESAAVSCSIAELVTQRNLPGHFISLEAGFDAATRLCSDAPRQMEISLELTPNSSLTYCAAPDVASIHEYLDRSGVTYRSLPCDWPHHTSRTGNIDGVADRLFKVTPRPLRVGFYSAFAGGLIQPGTALDGDHFYLASISTGLFGRAICAAIGDDITEFLNVSAYPALKSAIRESAKQTSADIVVFDSMDRDAPELETWESSFNALRSRLNLNLESKPRGSSAVGFSRDLPPYPEQVNLLRPDVIQNPYPLYAELRDSGPVHFLSEHGFWLVVGYDAVAGSLKQTELFSNSPGQQLDPVMVGADPPSHTRVRRIAAPWFSVQAIQKLENYTRETANRLLSEAANLPEFDFVNSFATPLTEIVIAHFLGLDEAESDRLRQRLAPWRYRLEKLAPILDEWAREFVLRAPSESICGRLVDTNQGEALSTDEAVSILKLLWIAGTTTTSMLISTSALLLLRHSNIRNTIENDRALIPSFVEEALRYDAPEQMAWRIARQDVEIEGARIPAGSEVRFCLGAANRDPVHFAEPDALSLRRSPNDHLSFAAGPHYCLGASIARLEARVAIECLMSEWPEFRPARHLATRSYLESFHFRALKNLYISRQ